MIGKKEGDIGAKRSKWAWEQRRTKRQTDKERMGGGLAKIKDVQKTLKKHTTF